MPRPSPDSICDAHSIVSHEVGVLADLHRPAELLMAGLCPPVEPSVAVAPGDAGPARAFGDAVRPDVELVASPVPLFAALRGGGLGGFCRVDEERRERTTERTTAALGGCCDRNMVSPTSGPTYGDPRRWLTQMQEPAIWSMPCLARQRLLSKWLV